MAERKKILIITYWSFNDALVQTYTLPYAKLISKALSEDSTIYLVTLDKINSQINNDLNNYNIKNISIPYKSFGIGGLMMVFKIIFKLFLLIKKEKITTLHAWCTPAGMIGYILTLFTKTELIIDSYEPHAEAMVENGAWKKNGIAFKLLFYFEKLQTQKANYLIATTESMKLYAKEKYNHTKNNFSVKPACVDLNLFSDSNIKNKKLLEELNLENKITCVYAGKFGGIYLDKEVFDFFKIAENYWGEHFRVLILSSHSSTEIEQKSKLSNLNSHTIVNKFVPHTKIADYIGLADFAITPVKSVPTKKHCTPIKDGEYWALGLPVVITKNISDDSDIIKENNIGSILEELTNEGYLKSIVEIDAILKNNSRNELYEKIRPVAEKYRNFRIAENIYNTLYGQ